MRVLLVCHQFPPDGVAGVERYTQALAAGLRGAGDSVMVATRRANGAARIETVREEMGDGTEVHRYVGGSVSLTRFLMDHEQLEEQFTRTLLEHTPDVVHINHLIGHSPRVIEIARRFGVPVVLSLHDFYSACPLAHLQKIRGGLCTGPDGGRECASTCFADDSDARLRWGLRTAYFRRLVDASDLITVPSLFLGEYLVAFGADASRLEIVPLGIAVSASTATPHRERDEDGLALAFVGVVVAHKGVHLIVDALRAAQLGRVDLRIVGHIVDQNYADGLTRAATAVPGLNLSFSGAFEPSELPERLRGVDLAVFPSVVPESFGLTAREALAMGIPVVASRIGALSEVVVHARNGLLVTPGNVADLAAALRLYAVDSTLRASLAEGACLTAYVTVDDHVAVMRSLYDRTLGAARPMNSADDAAEMDFLFSSLEDAGFGGRLRESTTGFPTRRREGFLRIRRRFRPSRQ
jgi:glycosyltransferase involved in cell wall biosynthesis